MKQSTKQTGNLLVSAAVLVTVIGLLAGSITYVMSTHASLSSGRSDRISAFYIAEAGIQLICLH